MSRLVRRFDAFWFAPAPALRLAVLRVLIVGFGLTWLLAMSTTLRDTTRLSASHFRPVGVVTWIDAPLDIELLLAVYLLCIAAGVAALVGWRYRVSAPVHAVALLWITSYRNSWGMVFHSENLWVMHTLILACLPAADAWSLDARKAVSGLRLPQRDPHGEACLRLRLPQRDPHGEAPGADAPDPRYGWGPKLMATVGALTYLLAGVAKLQNAGDAWLDGDVLLGHVAWDNLRKLELGAMYSPLGAALSTWPAVFAPLAWLSMVLELGAPLSLFGRRLAWIWTIGTWSFHLGIAALMAIVFPYPIVGIAFAPLFEIERPVLALATRVQGRARVLAYLLPTVPARDSGEKGVTSTCHPV